MRGVDKDLIREKEEAPLSLRASFHISGLRHKGRCLAAKISGKICDAAGEKTAAIQVRMPAPHSNIASFGLQFQFHNATHDRMYMAIPEMVMIALSHPLIKPYPVPISTKNMVVTGEKMSTILPSRSKKRTYRVADKVQSHTDESFSAFISGYFVGIISFIIMLVNR